MWTALFPPHTIGIVQRQMVTQTMSRADAERTFSAGKSWGDPVLLKVMPHLRVRVPNKRTLSGKRKLIQKQISFFKKPFQFKNSLNQNECKLLKNFHLRAFKVNALCSVKFGTVDLAMSGHVLLDDWLDVRFKTALWASKFSVHTVRNKVMS